MYKNKKDPLSGQDKFLIRSRGLTPFPLHYAEGVSATHVSTVVNEKTIHVQCSTLREVSGFFGVSYEEIEIVNYEEAQVIENTVSQHNNMNPSAVPVIKERDVVQRLDKRIGELVTLLPLTYYFGPSCNVIAVLVESPLLGTYDAGDVLIIQKGQWGSDKDKLAFDTATQKLCILPCSSGTPDGHCLIGDILEERFNDLFK